MTGQLGKLSVDEAIALQFKLVECIQKQFTDGSFLSLGDLGLAVNGKPAQTCRAEKVLAEFFGAEGCALVRGAGTGAIRCALESVITPGEKILLHRAAIYPTTEHTIQCMGLQTVFADFNDLSNLERVITQEKPVAAVIQHSRQLLTDSYSLDEVVQLISKLGVKTVVDDNYAIFKDNTDGIKAGADVTTFSLFKLQGAEGIGCVLGKSQIVEAISKSAGSGGTKVQGHEAMECLRGLVNAPVALAIQAGEIDKIYATMMDFKANGQHLVKNAFIANMQSRVVVVEFEKPIASGVMAQAAKLGVSTWPVGAESKYEIPPMFYKASRTFLSGENENRVEYFLRINPMRAGSASVLDVFKRSVELAAKGEDVCF